MYAPKRTQAPLRIWEIYRPDLKCYFRFDEGAGPVTNDLSGNGYVGTLVGGAIFNAGGKYSFAIDLNGAGKVTLGNGLFDLATVTVCCWIKTSGVGATDKRLVTTGSENTNKWILTINEANYVLMAASAAFHACPSSNAVVNDGVWHFIVGVSNPESLYVDGVLQTSTHTDSHSQEAGFKIGSRGSTYAYIGLMDEVMIFNRALSVLEILELYKLQYGYRVQNPLRVLTP